MTASPDLIRELAPTGRLRAALNFGNIVLAQRDAQGQPAGVTVDLARELARRLGLEVDFLSYESAGVVADQAQDGVWDIGFMARDPARATGISFTAPYVIIEGSYLVPADSPLNTIGDVDASGVRVAVGKGAAYDLFLSRTLKHAEIVRAATSADAIDLFVADKLEAVAGVKQPLIKYAAAHPGWRVIEGRFTAIEQAMAVPKGRAQAFAYVHAFVEEMKASGFVADGLARSQQFDAAVAPPEAMA